MRLRTILPAALVAAVLSLPGLAAAASFTGSWSLGALASDDPGLVVRTSAAGGGFATPDLAVGESYSFHLFRIWTDERSVEAGEDTVPRPIAVDFALDAPFAAAGAATGTTRGLRGPFFGQPQSGALDWDGPLTLAFGPGETGRLSLVLSEGIFNPLLTRFTSGAALGRDVKATLTYEIAPAPVPVPAALPLLLGALGLLGVAARRRAA